jgi:hypothetical protein
MNKDGTAARSLVFLGGEGGGYFEEQMYQWIEKGKMYQWICI